MSVPAATRRSLAPLAVVIAAAFPFALLLLLVRLHWVPLESGDHGAATRLNGLVAGHSVVVSIVKAVTGLGSGGVLWTLIVPAAGRWACPTARQQTTAGKLCGNLSEQRRKG
jgi:undecaprenyl-diphosphatase